MEILHRQGEIIRDRYQIVTTIGSGGMATTYAAVDLSNSQRVALKVLSLEQTDDWKTLELFEREAKILANLHHPFIPRYLDYFEFDLDDDRRFCLVQELVEGESLATLVEQNWQPREAEVKDIALQVLDILVYLHSLSPPVIHRDIKPQNIIRVPKGTRERNRLGQIYLVDFGAVQAVYRNTISVSGTFVGTLGYMSPEQLRGNVAIASDLYSLGCSLIFLLTQKPPTDLPQKRMKLCFRPYVDISPRFADWLDKLLEPDMSDRFDSAATALMALKSKRAMLRTAKNLRIAHSLSNRIYVISQTDRLQIEVAERGAGCVYYLFLLLGMIWSFTFLPLLLHNGGLFLSLMGLGGIITVVISLISIWYTGKKRTILDINPQHFNLRWTSFSLRQGLLFHELKGLTLDIDWVNLNIDKKRPGDSNLVDNTCAIFEGDRQYKFGLGYNLSLKEAEDITQEVSVFLKQLRR